MKAVNLIPLDAPGGRAGGARAGTPVYALLGVLAVLLVGVTAYVLTGNDVTKRRDELARLEVQVSAVRQQAERLHPYVEFASLAQTREQTVRQLGAARFNWHRAFTDVAKVLPDNVWLTSLLGTVAPGVSIEGGASGQTNSLRASVPSPAIELTGCTTSHDAVVRLISQLRLIEGAQRVSLADSVKKEASGAAGGGDGATEDDCRHGHLTFPQFDVVVFFNPLPAVPAPSDPATAATSSATATSGATEGGAQ